MGEVCPDCNEDHDLVPPVTVEELLKKAQFRYRCFVGLYFGSLFMGSVGAYLVLGPGGPLMTVGGFLYYLAKINMLGLNENAAMLRQLVKHPEDGPPPVDIKHGTYV